MKKLDVFEWFMVCLFLLMIGAGLMAAKGKPGVAIVSAPDKGMHLRY